MSYRLLIAFVISLTACVASGCDSVPESPTAVTTAPPPTQPASGLVASATGPTPTAQLADPTPTAQLADPAPTASSAGGVEVETAQAAPAEDAGTAPAEDAGTAPVEAEAAPAAQPPAPAGGGEKAADGLGPLNAEDEAVFWGSTADPPAEHLNAIKKEHENKHFLYSDELNQHLFYPHLKDIGGGFAGVGTDQCYLFIGWMKPNLSWLSDYDIWVVWLHYAYLAFFQEANNADEFREFFKRDNLEHARTTIRKYYGDREDVENIIDVFEIARAKAGRRLRRIQNKLKKLKVPSFLTDQATYDVVRSLIKNKRVRPILGNLLDKQGMVGIGETSHKLNVPVRGLYLSNAENYWSYSDQYKKNMKSLLFDEKSWVIRTSASKPRNGDYCYSLQKGQNFHEWLDQPYVTRIRNIIPYTPVKDETDIPLTIFNDEPFDRRKRKRKKKKSK